MVFWNPVDGKIEPGDLLWTCFHGEFLPVEVLAPLSGDRFEVHILFAGCSCLYVPRHELFVKRFE